MKFGRKNGFWWQNCLWLHFSAYIAIRPSGDAGAVRICGEDVALDVGGFGLWLQQSLVVTLPSAPCRRKKLGGVAFRFDGRPRVVQGGLYKADHG